MRESPAATLTAPRRGRVFVSRVLVAVGLAAAAAPACKLNQQGVPPPLDRIAWPSSAFVDPDGRWLYVANSNSDLRFNNGTLVAVDAEAAMSDRFGANGQAAPQWGICPGAEYVRKDSDAEPCCWDYLDHNVLDCDERLYVAADSTVEIGSFAAGMVFQPFTETGCDPAMNANDATQALRNAATASKDTKLRHQCNANCPSDPVEGRLLMGVRGNSTLTYTDTGRVADPVLGTRPTFTCFDPLSSDPHVCQVTQTMLGDDPAHGDLTTAIHVPDEPYALALDPQLDLLYVGNLRGDTMHPQTGGISLFDVSRTIPHGVPTFIGPTNSFFNADVNGNFGITSLTLYNGAVYACSRYGTNVVNVVPSLPFDASGGVCPAKPAFDMIGLGAGTDVFTSPLVGAEIRGIQFLPDIHRAFVLQRVPPALIGFDTSKDPAAFGNFPSDVLETCASPTFLQAYDSGEGMRLYVTCFDAGQIYVFDPHGPSLVGVIAAGRGPAGLAFPPTLRPDHRVAYIVGFSENDMGVLDLTPGSATQYHVVQRIGFPSTEPR